MSKRAVYTRHEDWVDASSSRRPWGANAGSGALGLCAAAAPDSGIGNFCRIGVTNPALIYRIHDSLHCSNTP